MALTQIKTAIQPNQLVEQINNNFSDVESRMVESGDLTAYQTKINVNGIPKGDGNGGFTATVPGTDYLRPADVTGKLDKSGGTMTGSIAMGNQKITGVGAPTNDGDAATKQYVDNAMGQINGFDILGGVSCAAVAADFDAGGVPVSTGDTKSRAAIATWLSGKGITAGNKDAIYVVFNITGVEEQRTWLYAYNGTAWTAQFPTTEIKMANGAQAGIVEAGGDVDIANGIITIKAGWVPAKATAVDGVVAAGNSKYYGTNGSGAPGFYALPEPGSTLTKLQFTAADAGWAQSGDVWNLAITTTKDPVAVYKEISTGVYRFVLCDVEKAAAAITVAAMEKFTGYVIAG